MQEDKYLKETLNAASNEKEVTQVIMGQLKVKADLNFDAMQEIKPYLEQGA